jgi:1-aminocyclopropane-1-carboxylate deaminase/D-cysteine desulfhydrase-like pyridoxal-dependent ACC family enzyme
VTSTLAQRFEGLARIAHVPLIDGPTPIERLAHVSEELGADVWVKRDDRSSGRYGGNKVRKLEWLLAAARAKDADTLVTFGGIGSHFVVACQAHGAALGFETHAVLFPQARTHQVDRQLALMDALGIHTHRATSYAGALAKLARIEIALRRRKVVVLPPGGSTRIGTIGFVEAALELASQLEANEMPEPKEIVVAAGSGGTAAGLAVGCALAGLSTQVVGVRVVDRYPGFERACRWLVDRTAALLRKHDARFPDIAANANELLVFDHRFAGPGYGDPTPQGASATELASRDGVSLEPTYTGKTFAAAIARAKDGPLLYWHTAPSPTHAAR